MSTSDYKETGNVHLDMKLQATLPYHEVIGRLVAAHSPDNSTVLDIGCGLGHIEREIYNNNPTLSVDIADAYDECLNTAASLTNVQNKFKIDELRFNITEVVTNKYDTIVMSHVLEHLLFPCEALDHVQSLLKPDGKLIVAVPNPVRPSVFLSNIIKFHYVNRGHVHAWAPSHWRNFLEEIIGFDVVSYHTDYIQLPKSTKSKTMRVLGKTLVAAAPWWGFSNIAVIKNTPKQENCVYQAYLRASAA